MKCCLYTGSKWSSCSVGSSLYLMLVSFLMFYYVYIYIYNRSMG